MIKNKTLLLPLRVFVTFIIVTIFLYLFGPIKYFEQIDFAIFLTTILLFLYIIAFYFGYKKGIYRKTKTKKISKDKVIKTISFLIYINFIFTLLNALQYSYTNNILELFNKAYNGLIDPNDVYLDKLQQMYLYGSPDSILTYITVFLGFIIFPTLVMSLYYFKDFKFHHKSLIIFTLVIEISRWLSIGTNKGIFDILILIIVIMLLKKIDSGSKGNKKYTLIIFLSSITIFLVFNYFIGSRLSSQFNPESFSRYPYKLIPNNYRFLVEKSTSYLTQGYNSMSTSIKHLNWTPMFGFGNSRFLMSVVERIFNIDIFQYTYAAKLQQFGIDPLANWHSGFTWLANDFSFIGVIFVMYFFGLLTSKLYRESIETKNPISITLFYLMVLQLVMITSTNYTLGFSNGFVAFWQLIIIRFVFGRINIVK